MRKPMQLLRERFPRQEKKEPLVGQERHSGLLIFYLAFEALLHHLHQLSFSLLAMKVGW